MGQPLAVTKSLPMAKSFQELGTEQFGEQFSATGVVAAMNLNLYKAAGADRGFANDEQFIESFMNIQKALATGTITGFADATALRLENLDDVMTSVLFDNSHLVLFNWLNRVVSKQPTYEWNRRTRYGGGRRTPGFIEGGTPRSATGAWSRQTIQTRFMGVRRGVTHVAGLTGALGGFQISPSEEEERSGTLDLLGIIERWAIHGDKDLQLLGGAEVNYDGILQAMTDAVTAGTISEVTAGGGTAGHVIDKAGNPLTFDDIEAGTVTTFKRGKIPNTTNQALFCDANVSAGLSMQKLPAERAVLAVDGIQTGRYVSGVPLGGFKTQRGVVPFRESLFMDEVEFNDPLLAAADTEPTAPASPTSPTSAVTSDSGATWSGTFYYWLSAISDGGESVAVAADSGASVAVASGQKCTLTITAQTGVTGYRVYRGEDSAGADAKLIGHVAAAASPTFIDRNHKIPGTTDVLLLYNARDSITIAQMSPLVKLQLGLISTTIEFLLLLYHVLVLKAPERMIWWKNVGSYIEA